MALAEGYPKNAVSARSKAALMAGKKAKMSGKTAGSKKTSRKTSSRKTTTSRGKK